MEYGMHRAERYHLKPNPLVLQPNAKKLQSARTLVIHTHWGVCCRANRYQAHCCKEGCDCRHKPCTHLRASKQGAPQPRPPPASLVIAMMESPLCCCCCYGAFKLIRCTISPPLASCCPSFPLLLLPGRLPIMLLLQGPPILLRLWGSGQRQHHLHLRRRLCPLGRRVRRSKSRAVREGLGFGATPLLIMEEI